MKKLSTLFLSLMTVLTISSCSNDDDNSTSASIIGEWEYYQEGEDLNNLELWEHEAVACGKDYIKIQKQEGTNDTYSYESGYFYTEDSECKKGTDSGTFTKNRNTITEVYDDETYTNTIVELSETTLILKEVDEEGTWYTVYKRK